MIKQHPKEKAEAESSSKKISEKTEKEAENKVKYKNETEQTEALHLQPGKIEQFSFSESEAVEKYSRVRSSVLKH